MDTLVYSCKKGLILNSDLLVMKMCFINMFFTFSGASPISNILPLLLLLDSGSDNMILILYIFGFLTAVPDPLIAG